MPILQWETAGHSCRRLRVSCSMFSVAITNTSINLECRVWAPGQVAVDHAVPIVSLCVHMI